MTRFPDGSGTAALRTTDVTGASGVSKVDVSELSWIRRSDGGVYEKSKKSQLAGVVTASIEHGLRQSEIEDLMQITPADIVAQDIIDELNDGEDLDAIVADLEIPFDCFDDPYWEDHPDMYAFETMLRSFIYAELRGIRYDNDLADFLDKHPEIAFKLGFQPDNEPGCPTLDAFQTPETPHQTTVTRCANKRFKARTEKFINSVANEVEEYCREHTHVLELTELWSEDPDTNPGEAEEELDPDGLSKTQIRRLVNELMRHLCPNMEFKRGQSKTIRKNLFLEVIAHCSLTNSSVYNGGDVYDIYAKPGDEELPAGKSFFDRMKGLTVDEMLEMFDDAVESMIGAAKDIDLYDRPVDIALDVTTVEFTGLGKTFGYDAIANPEDDDLKKREASEAKTAIEKWELEPIVGEDPADIKHANFDDPEKVAAAKRVKDCVEYVNGTKNHDDEIEYGFQFAAGAIAEKTCPMFVSVQPMTGRSQEEMCDHVRDSLERAQELVVIDSVYMDSYYSKSGVLNLFHYGNAFRMPDVFNVDYVAKMPEHERATKQVLEERYSDNHLEYDEGPTATTIKRNYAYGTSQTTETAHTTLVAIKKRKVDDVKDKVTDRVIFATNRQYADGGEAKRGINGYSDRWMIENGFKEAKKFLAKTHSSHRCPRIFYFVFALLLFNMWVLVDRVAKHRLGLEFAGEPIIGFEVLVAAVTESLRPVD